MSTWQSPTNPSEPNDDKPLVIHTLKCPNCFTEWEQVLSFCHNSPTENGRVIDGSCPRGCKHIKFPHLVYTKLDLVPAEAPAFNA